MICQSKTVDLFINDTCLTAYDQIEIKILV